MLTTDDLDALLVEAHGMIAQGAPGVAIATDDPLVLRRRLYPRMEALGIRFFVRVPSVPMELWLFPRKDGSEKDGSEDG